MDCIVKIEDFESQLKSFVGVQQGKRYEQYVSLEATEECLEIRGGTHETILALSLRTGESYRLCRSGSGTIDYYPLRRALRMFQGGGLLRLYSERDYLHLEDLKRSRTVLLQWEDKRTYYRMITKENCEAATISSKCLLHGIERVGYAIREYTPKSWGPKLDMYGNLVLTISKDHVYFVGGNGGRFVVCEMEGANGYSEDVEHTIYVPLTTVRTLKKNLHVGSKNTVTFYRRVIRGLPPVLLVEGHNFQISTECWDGGYLNFQKGCHSPMPVVATLSLLSLRPIIAVLRERYNKLSSDAHLTRMSFDFLKGYVRFTTNDSNTPFDVTIGLEPGMNETGNPEQTSSIIQCKPQYLVEMYDSSDHSGTIVIRSQYFDPNDDSQGTLCRIEYPLQNIEGNICIKQSMLISYSNRW